jgi:hypothetical protein
MIAALKSGRVPQAYAALQTIPGEVLDGDKDGKTDWKLCVAIPAMLISMVRPSRVIASIAPLYMQLLILCAQQVTGRCMRLQSVWSFDPLQAAVDYRRWDSGEVGKVGYIVVM